MDINLIIEICNRDEIQYVKGATYVRAIFGSFTTFHTRLALFFSICTYVLLGNFITAQKVNRFKKLLDSSP